MNPLSKAAALAPALAGRIGARAPWRRAWRLATATDRLATFVVVVLGWQTALFVALGLGAVPLVSYVAAQLVVCGGVAGLLAHRARRSGASERIATALQVVGWSFAAGPFGAFAAAALALPVRPPLPRPAASAAAREALSQSLSEEAVRQARVERVHTALLDGRLRLAAAARIRPLADVLSEGSRSERLEALRVVYRNYDPRLGALLRRAFHDPDASVRVLAATVAAKLHGSYVRAIGDRQGAAATSPDLEQSWLELAEARLAYATSGLLEPERAHAQIEAAIGDLERAVGFLSSQAAAARLASARRLLAEAAP